MPSISLMKLQRGFSGAQVLLMLLATVIVTIALSYFVIRTYIFPQPFTPVTLDQKAERKLESKLQVLGWQSESGGKASRDGKLTPEPYSESDDKRQVTFSEKEVNAIIGRSPDFAERVALDFSNNLASAKVLIPIPQDFPIMAGQILRVNAGLDIHLDQNRRPVVALVGVSLMGVPIPNAWLGNMKNVNLVSEFGDRGFWNAFADGVEDIQIREGELYIKLRK
ncbi:arginine N-succinyltransferase [Shewanella avicenniae]|uniref:Arginine N-succinyltransferase n=1 Tax=Shewanella avicenniae TaxID=2814294 RepID=A0ABX7QQ45_9GAMM|nr:arginine N-succinyltransferase [Shewanella avicenniae]QSX33599.1 arginine N-succinyltransferase [Shewanella avicenniae]